jgi:predicted dehydrogenase
MPDVGSLKVGVIGCGRIALSVHLRVWKNVVALAEPDPENRRHAARLAPGAVALEDWRELLDRRDVEAVLIAAPTGLHAEMAVAAFERGKHVYLEKPVATNLQDGAKVVEAWRRAGTVGMIGFNFRFNPVWQGLREVIQSGRLGNLAGVRSAFTTPPRPRPDWKQTRQTGGGVLLDLGSHHMDLVRWFLGREVEEVRASCRSQRLEQDTAVVELRLAGGLMVQSFFSQNAGDQDRFEVYGEAGKVALERYRSWRGARYLVRKLLSPHREPSYRAAWAHFVEAAGRGQGASPSLEDGYRSLEVIAAAEESARTGTAAPLLYTN